MRSFLLAVIVVAGGGILLSMLAAPFGLHLDLTKTIILSVGLTILLNFVLAMFRAG